MRTPRTPGWRWDCTCGPGYAFASVDLTPSYRATHPVLDNPAVAHVERDFIFVRALSALATTVQSVTVTDAGVNWDTAAPVPTQPPAAPSGLRVTPL